MIYTVCIILLLCACNNASNAERGRYVVVWVYTMLYMGKDWVAEQLRNEGIESPVVNYITVMRYKWHQLVWQAL